MTAIAEAAVPAWAPTIVTGPGVGTSERLDRFLRLAPAGYVAPAILFGEPEPLLVAGGGFVVVSAAAGLDPASVHTHGRFDWSRGFAGLARSVCHPAAEGPAPLVAANAEHGNYYHWTMQTLSAVLIAGTDVPLILPPAAAAWQRDGLALAGAASRPVLEVDRGTLGVFDRAVRTNLTGGDHAMAPHPAVLAAFAAAGARVPDGRHLPSRIYLSRRDAAGRRPLRNEALLAERLAARGFAIVETGALSLAEQVALIRAADMMVAPHGAALANLVYARDGADGPRVLELLQENYPNRCFLKIAQAKRLRYAALVGRCVDAARHHHQSAWEVDVDAVERLLDEI